MDWIVVAPFEAGITIKLPLQGEPPISSASSTLRDRFPALPTVTLPFGRPLRLQLDPTQHPAVRALASVPGVAIRDVYVDFYATGIGNLVVESSVGRSDADAVLDIDHQLCDLIFSGFIAPLADAARAYRNWVEMHARDRVIKLRHVRAVQPHWCYSIGICEGERLNARRLFVGRAADEFELTGHVTSGQPDVVRVNVGARYAILECADGTRRRPTSFVARPGIVTYGVEDYAAFIGYFGAAWECFVMMNQRLTEEVRVLLDDSLTPELSDHDRIEELRTLRSHAALLRQGFTPFNFGVNESLLRLVNGLNRAWTTGELMAAVDEKRQFIDLYYTQQIEREAEQRGQRIAITALVFTIMTLISVVADVLGSVDYSNRLVSSYVVRTAILFVPALIAAALTYAVWTRRPGRHVPTPLGSTRATSRTAD